MKDKQIIMVIYTTLNPLVNVNRLRGLSFMVACMVMALATAAVAQKPAAEPTLVPGSDVNLEAITGLDWVQGEGPTTFVLWSS